MLYEFGILLRACDQVDKWSVVMAGLAGRPASVPQYDTRPALPRDTHLPMDRRPRDKYAGVRSSGYSRRLPPSRLTASQSAYSPAVKQRTGWHVAVLFDKYFISYFLSLIVHCVSKKLCIFVSVRTSSNFHEF